MIKKIEHFWKGLSNDRNQISAQPPTQYGDRFLNFMSGITLSKEEAQREAQEKARQTAEELQQEQQPQERVASWNSIGRKSTTNSIPNAPTHLPPPPPGQSSGARSPEAEETMRKAEKAAMKSEKHGHTEQRVPERTIRTSGSAVTGILPSITTAAAPGLGGGNSQGRDSTTNPPFLETVEETGESSMRCGRNRSASRVSAVTAESDGRPMTPAKDYQEPLNPMLSHIRHAPSRAPPTPPKTAGGVSTNGNGYNKRLAKPESADSGIGVELGRTRSGHHLAPGASAGLKGQLSRDSLEKALPPLPMADGSS